MNPSTTQATPWGDTLLAASAEQLDAMYAVAHMLYDRADFMRAADVLRFIVLADPLRRDAWWALGACHEQAEEHDLAATLYDIGYRMSDDPQLGLLCARAHVRAGEHARAREVLDELNHGGASPATQAKCQSMLREMGVE